MVGMESYGCLRLGRGYLPWSISTPLCHGIYSGNYIRWNLFPLVNDHLEGSLVTMDARGYSRGNCGKSRDSKKRLVVNVADFSD
jgi:hypothetical protein